MTTNALAKHYPALSAAERLALMLAAAGRGDEVEHGRLTDAAPRVTWRVPHTFGRALALLGTFSQHRMERMDLAALFFKTAALADAATGKLATRLRGVTGVYGYLVRVHADGWARFCAAERLDPAACEAAAPGGLTLEQAGREAGAVGYTDAQAAEFVRRGGARRAGQPEDGGVGRRGAGRDVPVHAEPLGVTDPASPPGPGIWTVDGIRAGRVCSRRRTGHAGGRAMTASAGEAISPPIHGQKADRLIDRAQANAMLYLCSAVTGQILYVDCGYNIMGT